MRNDTEECESLKEIESRWRSRFLEAQANYQHAFTQHQRILIEFEQYLNEDEGSYAVAKARRAMAAALAEVTRTQELLVDLVLRRKLPSPDDEELLLFQDTQLSPKSDPG